MKSPSITLISFSVFLGLGSLGATGFAQTETPKTEGSESRVIRDPATHDSLSQSLRMAKQSDPIHNTGPAIGETEVDPSIALASRDLIKDSTIFCYRGALTLVPKRCVLYLPEHLKDRFEATSGAAVVPWNTFFLQNRGWIRTVEVTRDQAMGNEPLSEDMTKAFEKSMSVVVATFSGGPISVKPYVAPEVEISESSATSPTALIQGN